MGMPRLGALLLFLLGSSNGNPASKPYIAYRTSPFDQGDKLDHEITWDTDAAVQKHRSQIHPHNAVAPEQCPLQFSLGISKRTHTGHTGATGTGNAIRQPPIIQPVFPARGPGRQVVYNTQYEHLDLLSPAPLETMGGQGVKEALLQAADFPILLESSSFLTSPILHDVNGDGITDAILTDYDGGIYIVGLAGSPRYFHHAQVPRLSVRREWLERRVNETLNPELLLETAAATTEKDDKKLDDPYHSFFEFYHARTNQDEKVLRGVTGNLLGQNEVQLQALTERRNRRVSHDRAESSDSQDGSAKSAKPQKEDEEEEQPQRRRRLQEVDLNAGVEAVDAGIDQATQVDVQEGIDSNAGDQEEPHQETPPEGVADAQPVDPAPNVQDEPAQEQSPHEEVPEMEVQADQVLESNPGAQDQEQLRVDPPVEEHVEPVQEALTGVTEEHDTPEESSVETPLENPVTEVDEPKAVDESQPEITEEARIDATDHEGIIDAVDPVEKQQDDDNDDTEAESSDMDVDAEVERKLEEPKEDGSERGDDIYTDDPDPNRDLDDAYSGRGGDGDDYAADDPDYGTGGYGDDQYGHYSDYDDMYGHDEDHDEYYDNKHYIRIPPHILCNPVLAELPKLYGDKDEMDDVLFVAVSYYLDEDEYQGFFSYKRFQDTDRGDETEVKRGAYISSAIMAYTLGDSARWSGQTHLDLSTDFSAPENVTIVGTLPIHADVSQMGAFALSSPTIADLDGDGSLEVLLGTSMGIVYVFDARQMFKRDNWPIQMKRPVESRILVEDAVGDTNLEVFVADVGGNVVCFNHEAKPIWDRDLLTSLDLGESEVSGSSGMTLGDVDNDGVLDLVLVLRTKLASNSERTFVFALNAATGRDLPNFPIELDLVRLKKTAESNGLQERLAQPLLVDLHADVDFLNDYLRRNGTEWTQRHPSKLSAPPHGGSSRGLHIVQPLGEHLYIIEAGSGCSQKISIGAEVSSMVAVDDVHGTNRLDLVVVTETGNTITLESSSPYHPLNTWNHGEVRGRTNSHAHGYSASQGIFVHEVSRQYTDIFGVYVPITLEIFDNRPNIKNEPGRRKYAVDIRDGTSSKRVLWRKEYDEPGVYTERVYIRYGPGYYSLSVVMKTSHGLIYEDTFHIGYNVHFMDGFGSLLVVPLLVAAVTILLCGAKKSNWEDEEFDGDREGNGRGILGQELPS